MRTIEKIYDSTLGCYDFEYGSSDNNSLFYGCISNYSDKKSHLRFFNIEDNIEDVRTMVLIDDE